MIDQHCNRLAMLGYRPTSVQSRREVLRNFSRYMKPAALTDATQDDIEAFLARPLAAQTRRAYRGHLLRFYAWLEDEGRMSSNPAAKIPSIRTRRGLPRPIKEADLARAFAHAEPVMRAWLALMALAGLRACEVARLRPEDILTDELLYLRECKGGGAATVPAHPYIIACLTALPVRPDGLWWTESPKWVRICIAKHFRSLGIEATGHRLRHYAGTTWYRESGHDLLITAELMRHASVMSTQIYTQFDVSRTAEVARGVALPSAS